MHYIGVSSHITKEEWQANIETESCIEIPGLETDLSFNIPFLPPALSTRRPNSTWLFSNEKNDFQILFKFATWPPPLGLSPPSPTLIPFPVSVCSFTAGARRASNEDKRGWAGDQTLQVSFQENDDLRY